MISSITEASPDCRITLVTLQAYLRAAYCYLSKRK